MDLEDVLQGPALDVFHLQNGHCDLCHTGVESVKKWGLQRHGARRAACRYPRPLRLLPSSRVCLRPPCPVVHRRVGSGAPLHQGVRHADRAETAHTPAGTPGVWAHDPAPQPSGGPPLTARRGAARPPWTQGLADQFCVDRLSPSAWCPPPGLRVGAQLRLGAGGHRLCQNLLRAMLAGWIQRYQQRVARRDLLGELLTSYDHEAAGLEPICQPYRRG